MRPQRKLLIAAALSVMLIFGWIREIVMVDMHRMTEQVRLVQRVDRFRNTSPPVQRFEIGIHEKNARTS